MMRAHLPFLVYKVPYWKFTTPPMQFLILVPSGI